MRRVLLTGATGFVGSRCLAGLTAVGDEVHAVTSRPPVALADCAVRWHQADLLDPASVGAVVDRVHPTHLLHLAWYAVPAEFWSSPENFRWVQASLELFRRFAATGGARAVVAGTCAEYDWTIGAATFAEDAPRRPVTPYGVAKRALSDLLASHARLAGMSLAWGRIFHLHGPAEDPRRLVAGTICSLVRGEVARCSSGEQVRDFLHVQDVADAFVALLHGDTEGPVNVGSGRGVAVRDLVRYIARALEAEDLLQLGAVPRQPGEPAALVADATRLRDEVGWTPRFDLERGLDDSIAWWLKHEGVWCG